MQLLFVNPPTNDPAPQHPPQLLTSLIGVAQSDGDAIALLDLNLHKLGNDELRAELGRAPWDAIILAAEPFQYRHVKPILKTIAETCRGVLVIMAGGIARKEILELLPEIHVGVTGDPEPALLEILERYTSWNFKHVQGLVYRDGKELVATKPRPSMKNLDELGFPAWEFLDLNDDWDQGQLLRGYFYYNLGGDAQRRSLDLLCQRDTRFQSASYMLKQIRYLRLRYAINHVNILDPDFCGNTLRLEEFCHGMLGEDIARQVTFSCVGSLKTCGLDLLTLLKDAGCSSLNYDYERELLQAPLEAHRRLALPYHATMHVGYPDESPQEIIDKTRFMILNKIEGKPVLPAWDCERDLKTSSGSELSRALSRESPPNTSPWPTPVLYGLIELMHRRDLEAIREWAKS